MILLLTFKNYYFIINIKHIVNNSLLFGYRRITDKNCVAMYTVIIPSMKLEKFSSEIIRKRDINENFTCSHM